MNKGRKKNPKGLCQSEADPVLADGRVLAGTENKHVLQTSGIFSADM